VALTASSGDKSITEEYLAAITEAKGPLIRKPEKSMKAMALASVGAAIGHAAEGPAGAFLVAWLRSGGLPLNSRLILLMNFSWTASARVASAHVL